jgi:Fe2+ or Zn2+ uptake regulation protein
VKLSSEVTDRLAASGIRLTRQREEVLAVLLQKRDHPTAVEVFMRSKKHMETISLATVYNCLEALVESGLVKQVNLDRAPIAISSVKSAARCTTLKSRSRRLGICPLGT